MNNKILSLPSQLIRVWNKSGIDTISVIQATGRPEFQLIQTPRILRQYRQDVNALLQRARAVNWELSFATALKYQNIYLAKNLTTSGGELLTEQLARLQQLYKQPKELCLQRVELHGRKQWGVTSSVPLPKNRFIGSYTGELHPANLIINADYALNIFNSKLYIFLQLNAERKGNMLRFLNHSAKPNVENILLYFKGMYHSLFYTIDELDAGQPLVFDYGKDYWKSRGIKPE